MFQVGDKVVIMVGSFSGEEGEVAKILADHQAVVDLDKKKGLTYSFSTIRKA